MKKRFFTLLVLSAMFALTVPVQAQLKSLNKAVKKATTSAEETVKKTADDVSTSAKETAKNTVDAAEEAARDMAADKVSVKIVEWLDKNNKVLPDDNDYCKRLTSLVNNKYTSVDGLSLNYKVYENDEANILACANGSIRIYSGMMDFLTDEQLLGIVSVQIGHIKNKDVREALVKVASEDNASNAVSAQLDKILSFSGEKMGTFVNELIQVPYSAEQNTAADAFAYNLLKQNDADVKGLLTALEKFAEVEAAEDNEESVALKYITVNSSNAERIKTVAVE
ncbi:MAG: M48 family metalloprotease [Bacteroidales bacterium]|nr:M48 family metalloprotease [Bacteroidales bacterium]